MAKAHANPSERRSVGVALAPTGARLIPVFAFGMSLALFFAISYVLCVLFYLLFPGSVINHTVLSLFLPGFQLLTWPSFFLGLAEVLVFAWYIGLVFGPLYNFFASRWR